MVGDNLDTDVRFGVDGGLGGVLLVLSGVAKREDVEGMGKGERYRPNAYVERLSDLMG